MMWGYGTNMGWMMWLWGFLLLVGIALLVLVAVRLSGPGRTPGHQDAIQNGGVCRDLMRAGPGRSRSSMNALPGVKSRRRNTARA